MTLGNVIGRWLKKTRSPGKSSYREITSQAGRKNRERRVQRCGFKWLVFDAKVSGSRLAGFLLQNSRHFAQHFASVPKAASEFLTAISLIASRKASFLISV